MLAQQPQSPAPVTAPAADFDHVSPPGHLAQRDHAPRSLAPHATTNCPAA